MSIDSAMQAWYVRFSAVPVECAAAGSAGRETAVHRGYWPWRFYCVLSSLIIEKRLAEDCHLCKYTPLGNSLTKQYGR